MNARCDKVFNTPISLILVSYSASPSSHINTTNLGGTTDPPTGNITVRGASTRRAQRKRARRKQEIRFFKQSVLNMFSLQVCASYSVLHQQYPSLQVMTILFHVIALLWDTPLGYFILAQAPLAMYHGSNALTMLSIHPDLRFLIWSHIQSIFTVVLHI